jgi:hypothetical protein
MASGNNDKNPLGPTVPLIRAAVDLGNRAADAGDAAGARDLCVCAARLARKVRGVTELADFRLERALDESSSSADQAAGASVLLKAFASLLPDDATADPLPDDALAAAQQLIETAISIGAPAYNAGDQQGCYDVYSCTARMILATGIGTDAAQARLREALDQCPKLDGPDRKAWAMRHGFDAVLAMGSPAGPSLSPSAVRQLLATAIHIGAPAFNLGDIRGCYEVYACTARLLLHSADVAGEVKDRLRHALEEACVITDVARQAWIMRHTFDALLAKPDGTSVKK